MFETLKIWKHQGKQYIPDVTAVQLPEIFRGRPEILPIPCDESCTACIDICPGDSIVKDGKLSIDLGACIFCGACAESCPEQKIHFTNDYKIATTKRENLIVAEEQKAIDFAPEEVRAEIHSVFGRSLKLRQVSAAGDNSCELELNASGNVNFDMGRWGIEFVASPRHADGVVITGPISRNMAQALQICYDAIPEPKLVILVGTDAISGGMYQGSPALDRSFLDKYKVDLYVPGNPPHPLTFVNGILQLIQSKKVINR